MLVIWLLTTLNGTHISRFSTYMRKTLFLCTCLGHLWFILSQGALWDQADQKDNDLWKPNSSRETYEHEHIMKASTEAVPEKNTIPWAMLAFHPLFQLPEQKPPTETQGWIISNHSSSVYFIPKPSQSLLRLNKTSSLVTADEWTFILNIGRRWQRYKRVPKLCIVNVYNEFVVVAVLCSFFSTVSKSL